MKTRSLFQKTCSLFLKNPVNTVILTYNNINRNEFTAIFFLDLKKVYNTVCHKTLLRKLDHCGFCGPVNKLLDSYMLRHQFVSLNNNHSKTRLNGYGMLQGSTLSPLLFLLYINDLPNCVRIVPQAFADNNCLLRSQSNPIILQEKINQKVSPLCNYCN